MGLPKAVKITKNGVEYINQVDRCQYTLKELIRAALRDCGQLICKRTRQVIRRRTGRGAKNIQYWVRSKKEIPDLLVGIKPGGFYVGYQELGAPAMGIPKLGALANSTRANIAEMQKIQARYLSAIENEQTALRLISVEDYEGE